MHTPVLLPELSHRQEPQDLGPEDCRHWPPTSGRRSQVSALLRKEGGRYSASSLASLQRSRQYHVRMPSAVTGPGHLPTCFASPKHMCIAPPAGASPLLALVFATLVEQCCQLRPGRPLAWHLAQRFHVLHAGSCQHLMHHHMHSLPAGDVLTGSVGTTLPAW